MIMGLRMMVRRLSWWHNNGTGSLRADNCLAEPGFDLSNQRHFHHCHTKIQTDAKADRLNLVTRESLTGMMVIRAFGNQKHEEERLGKASAELRDKHRSSIGS